MLDVSMLVIKRSASLTLNGPHCHLKSEIRDHFQESGVFRIIDYIVGINLAQTTAKKTKAAFHRQVVTN